MLTADLKRGRKKVFAVTDLLNINARQLAVFCNIYIFTDICSDFFLFFSSSSKPIIEG